MQDRTIAAAAAETSRKTLLRQRARARTVLSLMGRYTPTYNMYAAQTKCRRKCTAIASAALLFAAGTAIYLQHQSLKNIDGVEKCKCFILYRYKYPYHRYP